MGVFYATDTDVKQAGDIAGSDMDARIRRALEAASRSIDGTRPGGGLVGRRFYPEILTRYFETLPTHDASVLPLGRYDLISATTVLSGSTTIASGDYFLEPQDGPPFDTIALKQTSYTAWPSGSAQRGIAITGLWGYNTDEAPAGTITAAIASTGATAINVSDVSKIGVGTIVRVDAERMIVTDRALLTTGQALQTPLTAFNDDQSVAVVTGSAFTAGETIVLDAETMLITAVAGNTLVVRRAYDGSTLDTHTGSTIYAPRLLTVTRGALGTTAATHLISAPLFRHVVPALAVSLCTAEALVILQQDGGAWSSQVTAGDGGAVSPGVGLADLRADAVRAFRKPVAWLGV
jgi:hypothetical protein